MTARLWNPAVETLSRAQVCDLENPLIVAQIQYCYQNSDFYRELFNQSGIDPKTITGHENLARLPFTDKSDFTSMQADGELLGRHQCAPFSDIIRFTCTGGSSGEPTRLGWTRKDIDSYNEMGARALWTMGCRPDEYVISCFNYSMYAGGIMDHGGFETLGAGILAYGIGQSQRLLTLLSRFPKREEGYSLYLTPSYAVRLIDVAKDMGVDLAALPVTKGYFSGEPGLQIPHYRDKIESAWQMTTHDMYGTAELGVHSGECDQFNGVHYSSAGYVAVELINEAAESIPFDDGAVGELVYTTLQREACPLIRLRSHDVVQISTDPCLCGRNSFRFELLGRSDDMFIIKGVNVFPLAVQASLLEHRPQITGEFFILLDDAPPHQNPPRLVIEISDSVEPGHYDNLKKTLVDAIRLKNNFRATIEFVIQGSIANEHKTRRLYRCYQGQQPPAYKALLSG
ncbi:MAG: phenylacetate-CoA ligase [Gammaproteobacteria bacterium]|jgi:phenylacetate-CoA ligase